MAKRAADEHRRRGGRDGGQGGAQVGPIRSRASPDGRAEIIVAAGNFAGRTTTIVGFSSEAQYRDGFGPFAPGFVSVPFGDAAALEAAITPNTAALPGRADSGRGRHHRAARRLPGAGARDLHAPRHPADLRRGPDRPRPHRCAARLRPRGRSVPMASLLGKALGGGLLPVSAFLRDRGGDGVVHARRPRQHLRRQSRSRPRSARRRSICCEASAWPNARACRGDELLAKLRALDHPAIAEVRGKGLLDRRRDRSGVRRARARSATACSRAAC